MNEGDKAAIVRFATGWNEAWAARGVAALLGMLLVGLALKNLLRRTGSRFGALARLLLGGLLLAFAARPQAMVDLYISIPYEHRVRFLVGGLSILVIGITLEAIRRTHLQERYALLWLATGGIILVSVFFPQILVLLRTVTGMTYNQAILAVAFSFLVLVAFHFSLSISAYRSNQAKIAQRVAILEERVEDLERSGGGETSATAAPAQGEAGPPKGTD